MALKSIKAGTNTSVIGTFTGKCCDANVVNNNDMHLGRDLFENLLNSEDYKMAMENHHYIGFLGHPENPDCQDFEHACIVMKDLRILDNGEIEGDFDLIDTPVGRIVKSFIDAGVNFGISIRGLGDVDGNGEVDPEGFIFRGFDLVTFPAYDDCIPEFKAIAASTDTKRKAAFKKVCASINANIKDISSSETLEFIQDQFNEGTDEFNIIQNRLDELACPDASEEEDCEVLKAKLDAVTNLYLDAVSKIHDLESQVAECQLANQDISVECSSAKMKYSHMKRIVSSQLETARKQSEIMSAANSDMDSKIRFTNNKLARVNASLDAANAKLAKMEAEYNKMVTANTQLRGRISDLIDRRRNDKEAIEAANHINLKYKHKIDATSDVISQKDSTIEDIKQKLHETVVANNKLESRASNLDDKNRELLSRVEAAEDMVLSYQQAYANIYANALGVYLKDLPVTASTTVDELKKMISSGTSTAGIPASPSIASNDDDSDDYETIEGDIDADEIDEFDGNYSAGLVTL